MVDIELSEEEMKKAIAFYLKAKCGVPVTEDVVQEKTKFTMHANGMGNQTFKARVKLEVEENFQQGPYR
jgi:uncharacterized protein YdgA (DUF945 family)